MLSYAFKALKSEGFSNIGCEDFDNIHNLFSAILCQGINNQVKRGLNKTYISQSKIQNTLRGKINVNETILQTSKQTKKLSCTFDILSQNNLLNRILKTAIMILLKSDEVTPPIKTKLKKTLIFFVDVALITPSQIKWNSLNFHKSNSSYQLLIYICHLLFDGMLIDSQKQNFKLANFIDEQRLCDLYEKFVLNYYIKHYPNLCPHSPKVDWVLNTNQKSFLPDMYTDIVLTNSQKKTTLIIDTKCYKNIVNTQFMKNSISSGNIYQIFAYVKNRALVDSNQVSGMLLYAKTTEPVCPDVKYTMSGNDIYAKTLDLNCDFDNIRAQLNHIAENIL